MPGMSGSSNLVRHLDEETVEGPGHPDQRPTGDIDIAVGRHETRGVRLP